jgi:hypothetical protein
MKKPAAFVLLLTTAACTSLQPVKEPTGYFARNAPRFVVVTTVDSTEVPDPIVVARPQLDGGTLTGMTDGETVSIPMVRIRTVSAVQKDKRRTAFALIGGAIGVGMVTYLMSNVGSKIDNSAVCVPSGDRSGNPYCSGYDGYVGVR